MANKLTSIYTCANCDAQFPKWSGRCTSCGAWGTLSAETLDDKQRQKQDLKIAPSKLINFSEVGGEGLKRIVTGVGELDRVLGGGIVPGSLILLGGEPGIGKSTLVAQIAGRLADDQTVVYVSGEESAEQIRSRLERLKIDLTKLKFLSETNAEKIVATLESARPKLVIIDSIQTVYSSLAQGEAGGISQIRASAVKFLELAKKFDIAVILIGHITKDGALAGPKSLEHIVDTVLYLEIENNREYRILRATKNRFGSVNEIGIFEMTGEGFREIADAGAVFLETDDSAVAGSAISAIIEGTRPFLVEVQALVSKTVFGYPQRKCSGFDLNRLQVLTAVLSKRAKINLMNQDIILNLVGGLKLNDPALDLAACFAIASSLSNVAISRQTLILGEVGLGGELRNISRLDERLKEAKKLGFKNAYIPAASQPKADGLKISKIKNVSEIVKHLE
jgi:DNA repair protein RadA/Sms